MMSEQRLAEIEEWIGTPEEFLISHVFHSEMAHEQDVSKAIKELIAEVRWLQLDNDSLKMELHSTLFYD
jgi:hypothetical protein